MQESGSSPSSPAPKKERHSHPDPLQGDGTSRARNVKDASSGGTDKKKGEHAKDALPSGDKRKEAAFSLHSSMQRFLCREVLMKRLLVLTALLPLFLFAGCGGGNPSSDTAQSPSASGSSSNSVEGYLNDNQDTQIIYVQWTESNGQFTGSWNTATLRNGKLFYDNPPITGTHDNSSGSINFIVNFGGTETAISGRLQNNKLQLQMQQNGQTTNWSFHTATNIDYQSALTAFQSRYPGT